MRGWLYGHLWWLVDLLHLIVDFIHQSPIYQYLGYKWLLTLDLFFAQGFFSVVTIFKFALCRDYNRKIEFLIQMNQKPIRIRTWWKNQKISPKQVSPTKQKRHLDFYQNWDTVQDYCSIAKVAFLAVEKSFWANQKLTWHWRVVRRYFSSSMESGNSGPSNAWYNRKHFHERHFLTPIFERPFICNISDISKPRPSWPMELLYSSRSWSSLSLKPLFVMANFWSISFSLLDDAKISSHHFRLKSCQSATISSAGWC